MCQFEAAQVLPEKANKLLLRTSSSGLKKTQGILRRENIQAHQDYEYAYSRTWKYGNEECMCKPSFELNFKPSCQIV